ncbi:MAG: hypothetical protein HY904_04075 [Deltaproteobacteria bacterium]|nr:hypothetical protein [Deltaproteobacteria bacterium]
MRHMRRLGLVAGMGAVVLGLAGFGSAGDAKDDIRDSKFFKVNLTRKKILEPGAHVGAALKLDLVSVTVDQPQYWPNEKAFLKIIMPGRGGGAFTAALQKRDAASKDFKGKLDGQGVAVLELMDGTTTRLQLGEYRVDVKTDDGKVTGTATFAVVDGTLGAMSFAYEFLQVTSADDLDRKDGAWFLGNAAGPGKRWGNGLNFKNELRVNNKGWDGDVLVHSRCMLPGCNGTYAGPSQKVDVRGGKFAGTLNVGGHSGPFQIEVVTDKGSLRHQFEGSSHVERDMVAVSGGMTFNHKAGLAPYEKTVQVPGRQIFVESARGRDDPMELVSVIAEGGRARATVRRVWKDPVVRTYRVKTDGTFDAADVGLKGDLTTGQTLEIPVGQPYTFLTVGGFVDGKFTEAWAVLFAPAEMDVKVDIPPSGAPRNAVPVNIAVATKDGKPVKVSGILEAFDNRVASKSPFSPLASSIGDSVRNVSNAVSSWSDRTGMDLRAPEEEKAEADYAPMPRARNGKGGGAGPAKKMKEAMAGARSMPILAAPSPMASGAMAPGAPPPPPGGARRPPTSEDEPQGEVVREGDKKVVFVGRVETDANGKATVEVTLPPQMGRVVFRFVAVNGLDHAQAQKEMDVTRQAAVEARIPRVLVPGAQLTIPMDVDNSTQETLTLTVTGPGLPKPQVFPVKPGRNSVELGWQAGSPGTLSLALRNPKGRLMDQRDLPVRMVSSEPVTYSRLVVVREGQSIVVGSDETARVYATPGGLLRGIVMNMVTTMESWFGHAEALSAQVAVRAVLIAAVHRHILDDEGLEQTLKVGLEKAVRDLSTAFYDPQEALIRPYPGIPGSTLWTAWVSRNLHSMIATLMQANVSDTLVTAALTQARDLAAKLDAGLTRRGISLEEAGGYNAQGDSVIPVEIDGKVVYRVPTDDAVTKWAVDKLLPRVDWNQKDTELAFSKAYDVFRFLRAFERVGALQYLTEIAKGLYAQGDLKRFGELYERITRGMILAQEPGMVQGPALLGGVYSTPMAMVRFMELLLMMGLKGGEPKGTVTADGKPMAFEESIRGAVTLKVPAGCVVRLDKQGSVDLFNPGRGETVARAALSTARAAMGGELGLTIELDAQRDPLEYYAIIAVPSTTSIKQTEDILSDYRGQLIYGQQGMGSQQMQLIAVPFRGSRTLRLLLEGAFKGSSGGVVAVRHVEDVTEVFSTRIPSVTVQ